MHLIAPWAKGGRLPNFRSFIDDGCRGTLAYGVPYLLTPQMWATVCTGRSAGHHGLFDYWQRDPKGRFREANGSAIEIERFWDVLSREGRTCGIVNVPFTYPPTPLKGFMISGQDAPGAHRNIAKPSSVYDELVARFGRYRLKDIFPSGRIKSDYLTLIEEDVKKQTDGFVHLLSSQAWDTFVCSFSAIAMAQHYYWSDMECDDESNPYRHVVEMAYASVDTAIGRLRDAAGPLANIIIMSECGAGPLRSGIQVNTWLERLGLLRHLHSLDDQVRTPLRRRLSERLRRDGQRVLPYSLFYWVNHSGLKRVIQSNLASSDVDWKHTRAYYKGKGEGNIYVNLRGREPFGIVPPGAEYEQVRDEVATGFAKLVDPETREPVVVRVWRREELFQGPHVERAPDLVVEWKDGAYMPTETDRDRNHVFVQRWREFMNWPTSGSHRQKGVLLAGGPDIRPGCDVGDHNLLDVAPTLLHMQGVDRPPEYEGRVIKELFDSSSAMHVP